MSTLRLPSMYAFAHGGQGRFAYRPIAKADRRQKNPPSPNPLAGVERLPVETDDCIAQGEPDETELDQVQDKAGIG